MTVTAAGVRDYRGMRERETERETKVKKGKKTNKLITINKIYKRKQRKFEK